MTYRELVFAGQLKLAKAMMVNTAADWPELPATDTDNTGLANCV